VREQDGIGFVRLNRKNGWPESSYRLELYASEDDVDLLFAGEFRTEGTDRPPIVVFE